MIQLKTTGGATFYWNNGPLSQIHFIIRRGT